MDRLNALVQVMALVHLAGGQAVTLLARKLLRRLAVAT